MEDQVAIVTEYIKGRTLQQLLKEKKVKGEKLSEREASCIVKYILKAVAYLHRKKLIHRDLKPANILIPEKQNY